MEKKSIALSELRQVTRKMRAAGLSNIQLSGTNWSIRLQFEPVQPPAHDVQSAHPAATPLPVAQAPAAICAPIPGKVLLYHPINGVAFAQPGQQIKQDGLLALVQAGSLYLPVTSPADGILTAISVTQNQRVEYGSEVALLRAAVIA